MGPYIEDAFSKVFWTIKWNESDLNTKFQPILNNIVNVITIVFFAQHTHYMADMVKQY